MSFINTLPQIGGVDKTPYSTGDIESVFDAAYAKAYPIKTVTTKVFQVLCTDAVTGFPEDLHGWKQCIFFHCYPLANTVVLIFNTWEPYKYKMLMYLPFNESGQKIVWFTE